MHHQLVRACGIFLALAALLLTRASEAAFTIEGLGTSHRVDGSPVCAGAPSTEVLANEDITNGRCTGLVMSNIPVGEFTSVTSPEAPLSINQYYNDDDGHNGLDVEGSTDCLGVNDVHAILSGRVIVSMSAAQTGGVNGWGETIVMASRASMYSEEIITHAYHHMHNHAKANHPEETTRRKSPCDLVNTGDLLGKEGSTGRSGGSHLHLTIRRWTNLAELQAAVKAFGTGKLDVLLGNAYPGKNSTALARHLDPEGLLFDWFSDVVTDGDYDWAVVPAAHMRHLGIEFGLFDGRYGAAQKVKRREAARWIKIASKRTLSFSTEPTFNDVPVKDQDFVYIEALAQPTDPSVPPVINPHPATGSFLPDNEIARAEALKMIVLAFYHDEYMDWYTSFWWLATYTASQVFSDVSVADWYYPFVSFGVEKGIVATNSSFTFQPTASVNRAEIAKWIIGGYDHKGALPAFPCGKACAAGEFCRPSTHTCEKVPKCVQIESEFCPVGGGLSDTCTNGIQDAGETGVDCGGSCGPCQACGDGVCNGSESQASCCNDCGGCPSCTNGQTMACGLCGTSTCTGGQFGACQNQGVCTPGQVQTQACNGTGTQSRSCSTGCQWGAWGACNGGCQCSLATCCSDGCYFDAQGTACGTCKVCNGSGSCSNATNGTACPGGTCQNGSCAASCGATTYWSPSLDSDTDSTGLQANQTINTGITVEVREAGAGLEARVCKVGGTFNSNIAFSVYDAVTNSTSGVAVSNLATAGLSCSSWVGLQNDTGYTQGQQFGGVWQVVSPATSASEWGWPYNGCSVSGSPGGTCWNGVNITLTRTCKP